MGRTSADQEPAGRERPLTYSRWLRRVAPAWVGYAGAVLVLAYASQRNAFPLAAAAAVALAASATIMNKTFRRDPSRNRRDLAGRLASIAALGGVSFALGWVLPAINGLLFLGVSMGYFVVGQALIELRVRSATGPLPGLVVVALSGLLLLEGLRALSAGVPAWGFVASAVAFVVFPIGLSLLSEHVLARMKKGRSPRGVLVVSVGVVLVATGHLLLPHEVPSITLLVTVALILFVGGVASNTDLDTIAVVVTVALLSTWAVGPHSESLTPTLSPEPRESALVAIGDSFTSGEGATDYFEGTNRRGRNECRRAPTAYPVKAVESENELVPNKVVFLACSGARIEHIFAKPQHVGEPPIAPEEAQADGLHQLANLARIRKLTRFDPALVVVSIGGNNARFGDIGRFCVLPGDCSELGQRWLDNLVEVREELAMVYRRIRAAVGRKVPVLVVPYPIPVDDDGCSWSVLASSEHRFLHGFTKQLDRVIADAAAEARFYFLQRMIKALKHAELRICDRSPGEVGVNFFAAHSVEGLFEDRINPRNWFHNSLHPNARGHAAMADVLVRWIERHPNLPPLRPRKQQTESPLATVEEIMRVPSYRHCGNVVDAPSNCDGTATEWSAARIGRVIERSVPPLLLIVGGSWIAWLWIIGTRRCNKPAAG